MSLLFLPQTQPARLWEALEIPECGDTGCLVFTHFTIHGNYTTLTSGKFLGSCVVQATSLPYKILMRGNSRQGSCWDSSCYLSFLRQQLLVGGGVSTLAASIFFFFPENMTPIHRSIVGGMKGHLGSDWWGSLCPQPPSRVKTTPPSMPQSLRPCLLFSSGHHRASYTANDPPFLG